MNPSDHEIAVLVICALNFIGNVSAMVMAWGSIRRQPSIDTEIAVLKKSVSDHDDAILNIGKSINMSVGMLHTKANNTNICLAGLVAAFNAKFKTNAEPPHVEKS